MGRPGLSSHVRREFWQQIRIGLPSSGATLLLPSSSTTHLRAVDNPIPLPKRFGSHDWHTRRAFTPDWEQDGRFRLRSWFGNESGFRRVLNV